MSGDTALASEVVLYGLMILNLAAVAAAGIWAWRRNVLPDQDESTAVLFAGEPEPFEESDHDHA